VPSVILPGHLCFRDEYLSQLPARSFRDINQTMIEQKPPVCNYEGSDYQKSFWDQGGRAYEDAAEARALKRLLPSGGEFMLELGAGAGRNTLRYKNFDRIALVDYSRTQLEQARQRLGDSDRYLYVAADVYNLPFVASLFDSATMIRTLHHMADPVLALLQVKRVMSPGGVFILEFANKRNLKAIARYLFGKQDWSPFSEEPIEFAKLNFNFHPKAVRRYLQECGFQIEKQLTVSHLRVGVLKRILPTSVLTGLDGLLQWTGSFIQVSPSVFTRSYVTGEGEPAVDSNIFICPACGAGLKGAKQDLYCGSCGETWNYDGGIYDFRIMGE
jgi:ubiquinone/menaquinone biosynthesis C-methylase UbiE